MSKTSAHPTGLRDRPAYPLGEAARYVRVAPATLRSWVVGRPYATNSGVRHSPALIKLADHERRLLSFNNLIESHVLRALRTARGIPVKAIRKALQYAADELGESRSDRPSRAAASLRRSSLSGSMLVSRRKRWRLITR